MEAAQVSIDWWIDKDNVVCVCVCVYTHTVGYYLVIKKNEIFAICNDMGGARQCNAKRKKSEKDKYHMISLICGI